jgi:hypothetical protein
MIYIADLNECEEVYGSCSQTCVNFKGHFKCSCVQGYRKEEDVTCRATGERSLGMPFPGVTCLQ